MIQNHYYVYQLRVNGEEHPFYIGKGRGNRAHHHFRESLLAKNTHKNNIIKKAIINGTGVSVEFVKKDLTNEEAISLEILLIAKYGKACDGSGILSNLTDGGEGISGFKRTQESIEKQRKTITGRKLSEEHKRKVGAAIAGRVVSEETKKKMSLSKIGTKMSSESIAKRVKAIVGRPLSSEHKEKLSEATSGSRAYQAKMTDDHVREARKLYEGGDITVTQLAEKYGIAIVTMSKILRRKTYRNVE